MNPMLSPQPLGAGEVTQEFKNDVTRQIAFSHGYDDALAHGNGRWLIYVGTVFEEAYDRGYGAGMCTVREADSAAVTAYLPISEPPAVHVGKHRAPGRVERLLSLVGAR